MAIEPSSCSSFGVVLSGLSFQQATTQILTGHNMSITTALLRRIPNRFHSKLTAADKLIPFFKDGMYMGWSGFTGVGYPKIMPTVLADHVEKNGLQGKLKFNLFVGASTGAETEDRWAKLDMIDRRYPHQVGKNIQKGINSGRIRFADKHLSMFPQHLQAGFYTKHRTDKKILDIAIVEATAIKSDGSIIAGASVGTTPEIIQAADKVIIEVNTRLPSFEGLHDIVLPELPPKRKAFAINQVDDRIGSVSIPCDPEKVIAILESDRPDNTTPNEEQDEGSIAIANHIIAFLQHEVSKGRLPKSLLPLQSGIGNIANAIIGGMSTGPFEDTYVWTEVLQDTFLDFFDQGKLTFASATSVRFSPQGFEKFYNNWDKYSHKLILRPQQISNAPEIIRRLGVIAMNTPVEFDIYGHANSTMVSGSRMINGLGGSGDFLRNAYISIMHAPSARPSKNDPFGISTVVPMATHVDQTEHDLDVYVTEQGLADLRGMSPRERALEIINKCAHPVYKPILKEYFTYAEKKCLAEGTGHEPHILDNVFDMHKNLRDKGTMRLDAWKFAK